MQWRESSLTVSESLHNGRKECGNACQGAVETKVDHPTSEDVRYNQRWDINTDDGNLRVNKKQIAHRCSRQLQRQPWVPAITGPFSCCMSYCLTSKHRRKVAAAYGGTSRVSCRCTYVTRESLIHPPPLLVFNSYMDPAATSFHRALVLRPFHDSIPTLDHR